MKFRTGEPDGHSSQKNDCSLRDSGKGHEATLGAEDILIVVYKWVHL